MKWRMYGGSKHGTPRKCKFNLYGCVYFGWWHPGSPRPSKAWRGDPGAHHPRICCSACVVLCWPVDFWRFVWLFWVCAFCCFQWFCRFVGLWVCQHFRVLFAYFVCDLGVLVKVLNIAVCVWGESFFFGVVDCIPCSEIHGCDGAEAAAARSPPPPWLPGPLCGRPPGSAFIKADQLDPWIKDQIKITLLPTISHLQLPNFVFCGRACPSHMTQNLVTVGAQLWTTERFLVDPWSMDYADPVW